MATGKTTKKHTINPETAKILEQYRNAGKGLPAGSDGADPADGSTNPNKPAGPPPAQPMRRSGTRGK